MGRWETLTPHTQAAVVVCLRGWLQLGDDPLIEAALATLDPHGVEPAPVVPYQAGHRGDTTDTHLPTEETS
ncbi:hypothetical protein [Micromonospora sp. NPDC023814]|uniref:hypothetical protein n=1 Tax=Micromonospora sp. NPDC023814 TaxID=3154596 RepID=UPI0034088EE6